MYSASSRWPFFVVLWIICAGPLCVAAFAADFWLGCAVLMPALAGMLLLAARAAALSRTS